MAEVELKIITPTKVVKTDTVFSVTVPGKEGELTVMPRHERSFALLKEGIVTIRKPATEDEFLAIGGGYLETDGKQISILVSHAYGQEEIDQQMVEKAMQQAKKIADETKDQQERTEALAAMRRSEVSLKLLQKHPRRRTISSSNE